MSCVMQLQRVIPSYVFYALGMSLVLVALVDTVYVIKLFSKGHVDKLWPVRTTSPLHPWCPQELYGRALHMCGTT
jgi:hypothetical protein